MPPRPDQQHMPVQLYDPNQMNRFPMPDETVKSVMLDNLTNLNNNGGIFNGVNGNTSKFSIENLPKEEVKVHEAVMDKAKVTELKNDFNKVLSMTLTDDSEYLDQCLYHASLFCDNKYALNCIYKCYNTKYADLIDARPTLKEWLNYCLQVLIFQTEKDFKMNCMSNSQTFKMPDLNSKIFLVPSRKRQQQDQSIAEDLIPKKKTIKHPFLEHEYYKLHHMIFNIGECAKYCIPGDFAELEMTSSHCVMARIISNNSTAPYEGLRVSFKKPILTSLSGCLRKTYIFLQIESLQPLQDVISNITDLSATKDCLQYGRAKATKFIDITTKRKTSNGEEVSNEDSREYYMALLTSISIFKRSNKTFQGKAYSDVVYVGNRDLTDIDTDEMDKFNAIVRGNVEQVNKVLEEYEKKLDV